jgi:hypothetical protein
MRLVGSIFFEFFLEFSLYFEMFILTILLPNPLNEYLLFAKLNYQIQEMRPYYR